MRLYRFPETFCRDSRPYWALFVGFVVCNLLLVYTLYTRQPERYRGLWRRFSAGSTNSSDAMTAQSAAFAPYFDISPSIVQKEQIEFIGMSMGKIRPTVGFPSLGAPDGGLQIQSVDKSSVPYMSGFRSGDIVVSVNRTPIYSIGDFERVIRQPGALSNGILFDVFKNGRLHYMTIEPVRAGPR